MSPRLTTLATWSLGKKETALKLKEAKAADLAKFTPSVDSVSNVMSQVASWRHVSASVLTGGSWKWE